MGMTLSSLPTAPRQPQGKRGAGRGDTAHSQLILLSIQLLAARLRYVLWVVGTPGQDTAPVFWSQPPGAVPTPVQGQNGRCAPLWSLFSSLLSQLHFRASGWLLCPSPPPVPAVQQLSRNTACASIISVCAPGVTGINIGFTILQWPHAGPQAVMLLQIREDKAGLCLPSGLGNGEESSALTTAGLPA